MQIDSLARVFEDAETRRRSLVERARSDDPVPAVFGGGGDVGGLGLLSNQSALAQHERQYTHNTGWVFSCVKTIAQRAAGQRVRVGRWKGTAAAPRPGSQADFEFRATRASMPLSMKQLASQVELVEHHPLIDAVERPNDIMTYWQLMFVSVASIVLTGKGYWWTYPNKTVERPWTVMPMPASWMTPRHKKNKLFDQWSVQPAASATPFTVPGNEIAYFYLPDPSNPLGAVSMLQAQSRSVVADEALSEAQRRAFSRGIFPGHALKVGRLPGADGTPGLRPHLTDEQRLQIIGMIKQSYRGVANYDEPLILDGLIEEVMKVSLTPREMDFIQSGKYTKSRITQGFGTNPIVMGELENANRASSYTADDNFCRSTINPLLDLMSQTLTMWVAPLFAAPSERLYVWIEPAMADDPEFQLTVEDSMTAYPSLTVNEKRMRHGYPPVAGGDVLWVPTTMRAVAVADLEAEAAAGGQQGGAGAGN